MPKKLMDCVEKVKASGKSESEAWAICQESTGLKPHEGCNICEIVALADRLDELGLKAEATDLDNILEKEGQWKWLKEKGQQFKDWFQTEKELDPQKRQVLTDIRKTHWNLISQINKAYQLLDNAGKSMHDPAAYMRDLNQAVDILQKDLGTALQNSQQQAEQAAQLVPAETQEAVPQEGQEATPQEGQEVPQEGQEAAPQGQGVSENVRRFQEVKKQYPAAQQVHYPEAEVPASEVDTEVIQPRTQAPAAPAAPAAPTAPAAKPKAEDVQLRRYNPRQKAEDTEFRGEAAIMSRLLKMADRLDEQGDKEAADKIDAFIKEAQLGWAKELGTQMGDKFRSRIGLIDEDLRQQHYTMMERLKSLYNNLQTLRQSVTSPDYPQQFQAAIQAGQEEFNALLEEAKSIQMKLNKEQPAEEGEEQPAEGQPAEGQPAEGQPAEGQPAAEEQGEENIDAKILEVLKTMTPEQKLSVLRLMQQSQKQGV